MPVYSTPMCFGPYLRYGIQTRFAYFTMMGYEPLVDRLLTLLVEVKKEIGERDFEMEIRRNAGLEPVEFVLQVARPRSRYLVLYVPPNLVDGSGVPTRWWDILCERVELSLPVKPRQPLPMSLRDLARPQCQNDLLMGIIDDGCPFANSSLQHRNGTTGTRVLALWDQNDRARVTDAASGDPFGRGLPDLQYGLEFWRDSVPANASAPRLLGMNDWVGLHTSAAGVQEEACYRDGGFVGLAPQIAHGAHVLDLMAGNMPPASRMGPIGAGLDRRDPPCWKQGGTAATPSDPAGDADIVFVQIPQAAVEDATGSWLGAHAIAGLTYIMSCARPGVTRNVVVTISYGPTTGPHDGGSLLEDALADLVSYYDGEGGRPKLDIVLASGNSYDTGNHVAVDVPPGAASEWQWRIPPDNTVPCFAEVWLDKNDAAHATVTLAAPGPTAGSATVVTQDLGDRHLWLFTVPPTIAQARTGAVAAYQPAAHGDWTLRVAITAQAAHAVSVNAYAARTEPNMHARTGSRASKFIDRAWEARFAASAAHAWSHGEFATAGSCVARDGTLNGMATAKVAGLYVAGCFKVSDGSKSPYASAGPARLPSTRQGPDFALPGDESDALRGILACGTRSGSVFRMVGTSTAAPQWARWLARTADASSTLPSPDNPGGVTEPTRRGAGNLAAP